MWRLCRTLCPVLSSPFPIYKSWSLDRTVVAVIKLTRLQRPWEMIKHNIPPWRTLEGSRWKEIGGRSSLASWKILWTRRTVATLATWRATWYRARGRSTRRAASWYASTSWCYFGNKHVFNGSSLLLIYYEVKHELYFKKQTNKTNQKNTNAKAANIELLSFCFQPFLHLNDFLLTTNRRSFCIL